MSQLHITQLKQNFEKELLESGENSVGKSMVGPTPSEMVLDPSVMLRKGIYDKVAAKVVL